MTDLHPTPLPPPTPASTITINTLISIPELVQPIVDHFGRPDICSCILVSRHWNQCFTPLLWHTVDTLSKPWQGLFRRHDCKYDLPRDKIAAWVRETVARHGHHIRHLTATWNVVLEAVAANSDCTNLTSLVVGSVMYHRKVTPLELETVTAALPHPPLTVLYATDQTATPLVQWLHLPWVSNRRIYRTGIVNEDLRRKITVERFWSLVQQNPGLVRLRFPTLGAMNDLSKEYILERLLALKELRDLDLELTLLDARTMLRLFPKLERLGIYNMDGLLMLPAQEQYRNLRHLGLRTYVLFTNVLKVLHHLPGLEELWIKGVAVEPVGHLRTTLASIPITLSSNGPSTRGNEVVVSPPVIKAFYIDETLPRDDESIALLVRRFPRLVQIRAGVNRATKKALWEHCYYLEEMHGVKGGAEAWKRRRIEDKRKRCK
ncbi:hypothetical protein BGX30_004149 [Mortierella sp. GBA39]|nr:hypothetical protein BGX30_004149 [Mortierella sp. GBA39]